MQIHKDIIQKSPEWFAIRNLKLSASHAQAIAAGGKGLETYVTEMMSEYLSSGEKENFSSSDTERGNELEPIARAIYELESGDTVEEVGCVTEGDYLLCSPDGLIGEDGGLEIKCLKDVNHYKVILNGLDEVETKYLWQVQMNLLITGRKYWKLVIYNPNFEKGMLIFEILPNIEQFEKLKVGIAKGIELIKCQMKNVQG